MMEDSDDSDISIHAPREGGDVVGIRLFVTITLFQSTPPARGATWMASLHQNLSQDFNPRPPRGGRPIREVISRPLEGISIHAPREGGDRSG